MTRFRQQAALRRNSPLGGQRSTRSDKRGGKFRRQAALRRNSPLGGQRSTRSDKRGGHFSAFRGSSASRKASPMKVSSSKVSTSTQKVASEIHQASMLFLPCDSSSPSDGVPGGTPRPRKSSAVSYTHLRAHETDSYLVC